VWFGRPPQGTLGRCPRPVWSALCRAGRGGPGGIRGGRWRGCRGGGGVLAGVRSGAPCPTGSPPPPRRTAWGRSAPHRPNRARAPGGPRPVPVGMVASAPRRRPGRRRHPPPPRRRGPPCRPAARCPDDTPAACLPPRELLGWPPRLFSFSFSPRVRPPHPATRPQSLLTLTRDVSHPPPGPFYARFVPLVRRGGRSSRRWPPPHGCRTPRRPLPTAGHSTSHTLCRRDGQRRQVDERRRRSRPGMRAAPPGPHLDSPISSAPPPHPPPLQHSDW
jgi:hypothetical protein